MTKRKPRLDVTYIWNEKKQQFAVTATGSGDVRRVTIAEKGSNV